MQTAALDVSPLVELPRPAPDLPLLITPAETAAKANRVPAFE